MNEDLIILYVFPALFIMLPIHCILCKRSHATGRRKNFFFLLPLRVGFYTWFSLIVLLLVVKIEWTDLVIYFSLFMLPLLLIYYLFIYVIIYLLTLLFKFMKKCYFQ